MTDKGAAGKSGVHKQDERQNPGNLEEKWRS